MPSSKLTITITDDSMSSAVNGSTIPLFFIATAQDKVASDGLTIYPGTKKEYANELFLLSGTKDCIDKFGSPIFQEENATVLQGDELNEYGLWSLYSYLQKSGSAYAIRADIDLNQLKMTEVAPTSDPDNGTIWFDTTSTVFGLFRSNGSSEISEAWDSVSVRVPGKDYVDEQSVPVESYGSNGDIAVVTLNEDGTTNKYNKFYEKINGVWYDIGSDKWSDALPTIAMAALSDPQDIPVTSTLIINNVSIPLNGEISTTGDYITVDAIAQLISPQGVPALIDDVVASVDEETHTLKITNLDGGDIVLEGTSLYYIGFTSQPSDTVKTYEGVKLFYKPHTSIPSGCAGSIWIKTTKPNSGSQYYLKQYQKSTNQWTEISAPLYSSDIEAEIAYGTGLTVGSVYVKYPEVPVETKEVFRKFGLTGGLTVTGSAAITLDDIHENDVIGVTVAYKGEPVEYKVIIPAVTSEIDIINVFSDAKIPGVSVEITSGNAIRFVRDSGNAIKFRNIKGTSLLGLHIAEGEYSKWEDLEYVAKTTAPRNDPTDDTMWINSNYIADIMINDGDEWKGLLNYNINLDPVGVQMTSLEPLTQSTGASLVSGDLWIDTANSENYPALYVWKNKQWNKVDLTDQTSPFGIIFADARENAGPSYDGSKHLAFSTDPIEMNKSDYVDPDTPDPRSYPAGMMLFNTRYSSRNVKKYKSEYFENLEEATFTVGKSKEFITPGFEGNVKVSRWVNASGNQLDGAAYMGRKAQRIMIVRALASAIVSNEDCRADTFQYNLLACPGYVELYDELASLNVDRKETAYIVVDTPPRLKPDSTEIQRWANNYYNAASNGEDGLVTRYTYSCITYPWGLGTNLDGTEIMIPSSAMKLAALAYNDAVSYPWKSAAGVRRGNVLNASSVGFLNDENEYEPVVLNESLCDVLYDNSINPIKTIPNTGIVIWGDKTLQGYASALDRENVARLVCYIRTALKPLMLPFFFELNNDKTRREAKSVVEKLLADLMAKEALTDFAVVCDKSNNTASRIDNNELWIDVAICPTKSINWIYVPIRIVNTDEL